MSRSLQLHSRCSRSQLQTEWPSLSCQTRTECRQRTASYQWLMPQQRCTGQAPPRPGTAWCSSLSRNQKTAALKLLWIGCAAVTLAMNPSFGVGQKVSRSTFNARLCTYNVQPAGERVSDAYIMKTTFFAAICSVLGRECRHVPQNYASLVCSWAKVAISAPMTSATAYRDATIAWNPISSPSGLQQPGQA